MKVRAITKSVRMSPRKLREVASLVRGRTTNDALTILEHTPRRAAKPLAKTIESAVANAINNHNLKRDDLVISELRIDLAPSLKRFRPAAHGRALPYKRRSSHIFVQVEGKAPEARVKNTSSASSKSSANKAPKKKTGPKTKEAVKKEKK